MRTTLTLLAVLAVAACSRACPAPLAIPPPALPEPPPPPPAAPAAPVTSLIQDYNATAKHELPSDPTQTTPEHVRAVRQAGNAAQAAVLDAKRTGDRKAISKAKAAVSRFKAVVNTPPQVSTP